MGAQGDWGPPPGLHILGEGILDKQDQNWEEAQGMDKVRFHIVKSRALEQMVKGTVACGPF